MKIDEIRDVRAMTGLERLPKEELTGLAPAHDEYWLPQVNCTCGGGWTPGLSTTEFGYRFVRMTHRCAVCGRIHVIHFDTLSGEFTGSKGDPIGLEPSGCVSHIRLRKRLAAQRSA